MLAAEAAALHHLPDGADHRLGIVRHLAAEQDQLRAEHVYDVDNTGAEHGLILFDDLLQVNVSFGCAAEDLLRCQYAFGRLLRSTDQCGDGNICLKAAPSAAGTASAIYADNLMAYFTAAHDAALKDLSVQDDAAADTAAEGKHYNVGIVFSGSCNSFSQRRAVGIVGDSDRAGNHTAKFTGKVHILPAEVVGIHDFSFPPVNGSRDTRSDADTLVKGNVLLLQKIQCRLCNFTDVLQGLFFRICGELAHRDDLLVVVDKADLCLGTADDHTDPDRARLLADRRQKRVASAFNLPVTAACRQEKAVALAVGDGLSFTADLSFSVQDQNTQERCFVDGSLHAISEVSIEIELIDCEIIAVRNMRIFASAADDRHTACHGQGLFDVQVTLFPVLTYSSVIIDTIGNIGILLDLGDQDSFADRMKGSGFDKQDITLFHRYCVEHFQKGILLNSLREFLPGDLFLETIVKEGSFFRVKDIPHLCFSVLSLVLQGKTIAGMNLDREIVPCVNKLGQNRKLPESPAMCAKHFHALNIQILLQGFSRIRAVHDHGGAVRMAGKFPGLCKDLSVILYVIFIHQPVSAPEIIFTRRL